MLSDICPSTASSAYPPSSYIPIESAFSKYSIKRTFPFSNSEISQIISYRALTVADVDELERLHHEWFPARYGETFYQSACHRDTTSIIAVINCITTEFNKELLLGEKPLGAEDGSEVEEGACPSSTVEAEGLSNVCEAQANAATGVMREAISASHSCETAGDERYGMSKSATSELSAKEFIVAGIISSLDTKVLTYDERNSIIRINWCMRRPSVYSYNKMCTHYTGCVPNDGISNMENEGHTSCEGYSSCPGVSHAVKLWSSITIDPNAVAYIHSLGVAEKCRRIGVGKELLLRTIAHYEAQHTCPKALCLHVIEYNVAAIKLYESIGFVRIKYTPRYYSFNGKSYGSYLYAYYFDEIPPMSQNIFQNVWNYLKQLFRV